jgi:hypothetical protein
MPFRAALVFACLVLAAPPAFAQALGSVHCKAALRQIDIDLKATQRKLDSVQTSTADAKCSAIRVHVLTLEHASEVFGRCTEGQERMENVGQADASAAEFRAKFAQSCGG